MVVRYYLNAVKSLLQHEQPVPKNPVCSSKKHSYIWAGLVCFAIMLVPLQALAASILQSINFSQLAGEKVQIKLSFSGPAVEPDLG